MKPDELAKAGNASAGSGDGGGAGAKDDPDRKNNLALADAALAGRFKIVEKPGPNDPPNAITKEKYAEMCGQYADISSGKSDIKLNTAGMTADQEAEFRKNAMNDIANIMQTEGGREMLGALNDNVVRDKDGKPIPGPDGKPQHRTTNIGDSKNPEVPTAKAHDNVAAQDPKSNGSGTDIEYRPGHFADAGRSDVMLFHELRHAYDNSRGLQASGKIDAAEAQGPDAGQSVNLSEYQAVGLGRYDAKSPVKERPATRWDNGPVPLPNKTPDDPTENSYRAERARIAELAGKEQKGVVEGDAGMAQRTSYDGWKDPGKPPPKTT
jgi:hypothetical protein